MSVEEYGISQLRHIQGHNFCETSACSMWNPLISGLHIVLWKNCSFVEKSLNLKIPKTVRLGNILTPVLYMFQILVF